MRQFKHARAWAFWVIAFGYGCASCAGFTRGLPPQEHWYPFPAEEEFAPSSLTETQRLIVEGGLSLVGRGVLRVNGATYANDCTGVVLAAYAFASIDLAKDFNQYRGNGVRRLYEILRHKDLLYSVHFPRPGDLIFWDNTYDANGNGLNDDEFTHAGLVMDVDGEGTISYLHYNYRLGTVVERMNLTRPDDTTRGPEGPLNASLRMRGSPPGVGTNAAQLFRVFGKAHELKAAQ